jgi:PAS domain S-box-containing protein
MTGLEPDSGLDHPVSGARTSRSNDCVFSLDLDWRFTSANEPAARLADCTPSELVGRDIWEVFPEAVGSELDRRFRWALEHQQPVEFEGSLAPAATRLAVRARPGPDGLTVYVQDVSERRRGERQTLVAEPTLEQSERGRRLAFDGAAVGMMLVSPDRRIVEANAALGRMLGYEPKELVGRLIPELTHPDDVEVIEGTFDEIAKRRVESPAFDQRYLRRDGSPLWARVGVSPARHADGSLEFLVAQVEDITPLKQAEEELARSRRLYELVMEHAPDLIAVADLDGTIRLVSRSVERVLA